jgi:type II secretory pathway predicted ATPase ExeA
MAAPRTEFYHPAAVIDAALGSIERAIRRAEGLALVVGPAGTGKSLLLAKVAENVRDDFDCAFLSGARICTRRALWQSVLAAIGEPYRGIGESDLRMAVIERIRGLAAAGSGLVLLVDEAHTLPTRLLEELRLLTNVPTPLPAVHIVLAGSPKLEETLGLPRLESLAQRIAVRAYLEPLDHTETLAYLRTQTRAAGLAWDRLFAPGADDAVFAATDGVPRLINQLCDQALVTAGDSGRCVTATDIAAAWGEIQRLPVPAAIARAGLVDGVRHTGDDLGPAGAAEPYGVVEFGGLDADDRLLDADDRLIVGTSGSGATDPWVGPDVEFVFDGGEDPFEEFFALEERVVERYLVRGPAEFRGHPAVTSREGSDIGGLLADFDREARDVPDAAAVDHGIPHHAAARGATGSVTGRAGAELTIAETTVEDDDTDMVVIEEDLDALAAPLGAVFTVRPGDYRSLFTRLRRGDRRS